jgi:hypothetical protein
MSARRTLAPTRQLNNVVLCAPLRALSSSAAGALVERSLESDRPFMLRKKVGKSFVGDLLEIHHAVARQQIDGRPSLVVELHALARHGAASFMLEMNNNRASKEWEQNMSDQRWLHPSLRIMRPQMHQRNGAAGKD